MENLFGLTIPDIEERCAVLGIQSYRAEQIADWIYHKGIVSFERMTNLPLKLRDLLSASFVVSRPVCVERWDSTDGQTSKFLLEFDDGTAVETVLMRQSYGNSVCISTQAGCAMGCTFCASTLLGVERNLTAGEMAAEILFIDEMLRRSGEKVDTIVLMGSGEPLMNYDNVLSCLRLIHEPYCLNMSYRNMTLSTSGIIPRIGRLADEGLPITLAISLHASNDELRSELMPINKKYPLRELIASGRSYGEKTKRRVTYEYILIQGINDREVDALALASLLRGQLAGVNLIPINPVRERQWERPSPARIKGFLQILESAHITATVRHEMGTDIQAACGQLRNRHMVK